MNKANDCLMIGSYVCGLNSELFLHTDNHQLFFLLDEKNVACVVDYNQKG